MKRGKVVTPYKSQTNNLAEVSNTEIKAILAKSVNASRTNWARKLVDASWAYWIDFTTSIDIFPNQQVFGKACHLPLELEHRALWSLKKLNLD